MRNRLLTGAGKQVGNAVPSQHGVIDKPWPEGFVRHSDTRARPKKPRQQREEVPMSVHIFISHSAADSELGVQLVELLQALIAGAEIGCSSLPGHVPEGGDDSFAALKQQLASTDVVVGLITGSAIASGEVPFQLGAAWALGKPLLLLLGADGSAAELYLPMGHAEALVLGPEALLELAASIATSTGLRAETGAAAREALARLFPDWHGLDRQSTERPIGNGEKDSGDTQPLWPVERESGDTAELAGASAEHTGHTGHTGHNGGQRAGLPSCDASLQAGRAVSECVFNRDEGGSFADELDLPFGAFLASLGGNWSALRDLEDLDVWMEAAENVLGGLGPAEDHVRRWYEVGFQLATLLNLAARELDGGAQQDAELEELWHAASHQFRQSALAATVDESAIEELQNMLDNLRGPQHARDYANLGRVQERMRELAGSCDLGAVAVSA